MKLRRTKSLSFRVRSHTGGSLAEQVVRGIRAVVHTGRFVAGERLPTLSDMSAELGVSMNTVRLAVERLADEGMLEVRRSSGIRVRGAHEPRFRGHVVVISFASPFSFYSAVRNHAFLEALHRRDVHVTVVRASGTESVRGFSTLRHLLATQPVTLAVVDGDRLARDRRLGKLLVERGVRFVQRRVRKASPAAVDSLFLDIAPAYHQLARHCARCGMKKVYFFSGLEDPWICFRDAAKPLRLRVVRCRIDIGRKHLERAAEVGIERDGYSVLARWLKQGRIERGRAMLVSTDDYFTRGAMVALLKAGWQVPRDLQVATLANAGHIPVTGVSLTRVEMYPMRDGEAMAEVVLRNLAPQKRRPKPLVVRPRFVVGESTQPRVGP